jgi:hypothetical protein
MFEKAVFDPVTFAVMFGASFEHRIGKAPTNKSRPREFF